MGNRFRYHAARKILVRPFYRHMAAGPALVFLLLGGAFLFTWQLIAEHRADLLRLQTDVTARQSAQRLEEYLQTRLKLVDQIRKEWLAGEPPKREDFLVRSLALQEEFAGYQAVSWIDPEGILRWVVPREPNISAENRDLHEHPFAAQTFLAAERTRKVHMTPPLTLWQGGLGFATYHPLVRDGELEGYINGVFRIRPLVEECLRSDTLEHLALRIRFDGQEIYSNNLVLTSRNQRFSAAQEIRILDQKWTVSMAPSLALLPTRIQLLQSALLGLGLLLAAVTAWMYWLQIRRQQQLLESESKYRTLFEGSLDTIFISTPDGRLLDINDAGVALFDGAHREELQEASLPHRLFARAQDFDDLADQLRSRGFVKSLPVELVTLQDEPISALVSATVVRGSDGSIEAHHGIIHDTSEERRLQDQVIRMQKMESLGILAGGIAHDFNNLMGSVAGHASLLRIKADAELDHHAELIEKSVRRGKALTDQLLAFARGGSGRREGVDLNETLDETLRILSRTLDRSIEISRFLAPDLPLVEGDPGQLQQVVMNLCLNAREAMPEGGALTVETALAPAPPEATPRSDREDQDPTSTNFLRLVVRDTGQGIDAELRDRIFEPFVSTKEGGRGTGLGLAVVYGIVAQHRGYVTVESRPGKGSAFFVYLPASRRVALPERKPEAAPSRGSEQILIVDDDEDLLLVLRESLENHGYSVIHAEDGEKAVSRFRDNLGRIDLVILDMIMPRMGGKQAFEEIRSLDPAAKILLTTGYAGHQDTVALMDQGARGCLQKPFGAPELLSAVRKTLDDPL